MREIIDKINEIDAKAQEFHDKEDIFSMTYCMGQINILRWLLDNTIITHARNIDSIQAGYAEEER